VIDVRQVISTLSYVQRKAILEMGEAERLLHEIRVGSRGDAIRTIKSLFFLVDRLPNAKLTCFTYRLNAAGLEVLRLLRSQPAEAFGAMRHAADGVTAATWLPAGSRRSAA